MSWNYQAIQQTTRRVSGQISNVTLTNIDLGQYINNFYQFDLPRELKLEELYVQRQFPLVPNQPTYTLPGAFTNNLAFTHIEPRVYIDGVAIRYTQDTNVFYSIIPNNFSHETLTTTAALPHTYTTDFSPIANARSDYLAFTQGSNVVITDGVETITDVPTIGTYGTGTLVGNLGGTGTVNYTTGALSFTFNTTPAVGTVVDIGYHYINVGMPNTVLFYARQFTFYPAPDTAYQCRVDAYQQPAAMVNPTDTPEKQEWAEFIALGAALKILRDYGQSDKYQEVMIYYNRERTKCLSDTDNQLMATRTTPRF